MPAPVLQVLHARITLTWNDLMCSNYCPYNVAAGPLTNEQAVG
jgi:hypothetical protein